MPTNSTSRPLYQEASRATALGLVVNLALGLAKLAVGMLCNSIALLSDGVNSIGDAITSVVVLYALHVAQRPPDEEHPYGHTRAEAIAASNVALLIILSACYIAWEAVRRIGAGHPTPAAWVLWFAAGNIAIKEGLYQYKVRVGRRTGSAAILAHAWDHRADALCSTAVLVGLAAVRWGGSAWWWADEVAALVVATAIVFSGLKIFRQSSSELMDPQADEQLVNRIREAAASIEGVAAVEKLWVRKTGLEYLADIHIEVDAQLTVDAGHRIGHRVKDHLVGRFTSLRDVLVHLEPYPHLHEQKNLSQPGSND